MDSKLKKVLHHWDLFDFEEHSSGIKEKFVSAKLNEGFLRKILFDDLSENIIYYRGISPGNATKS